MQNEISDSHLDLPRDYIKSNGFGTCTWITVISKNQLIYALTHKNWRHKGPVITRSWSDKASVKVACMTSKIFVNFNHLHNGVLIKFMICGLTGKSTSLPLSHWILEIQRRQTLFYFIWSWNDLSVNSPSALCFNASLPSFLSRSIGFNTGYIKFGFNICALAMNFFFFCYFLVSVLYWSFEKKQSSGSPVNPGKDSYETTNISNIPKNTTWTNLAGPGPL